MCSNVQITNKDNKMKKIALAVLAAVGMMRGDANSDPLRKVLRFPFNGMKLMDDGVHQAQEKGQRSYYWSADPGDAQDSFNVAVISPTGCGYTEEAEPGTRCAVRFVREVT